MKYGFRNIFDTFPGRSGKTGNRRVGSGRRLADHSRFAKRELRRNHTRIGKPEGLILRYVQRREAAPTVSGARLKDKRRAKTKKRKTARKPKKRK